MIAQWFEGWQAEELRKWQLEDPEVALVVELKGKQKERPKPTEISREGYSVKALVAQWDQLVLRQGVLYRRIERIQV